MNAKKTLDLRLGLALLEIRLKSTYIAFGSHALNFGIKIKVWVGFVGLENNEDPQFHLV